MPTIALVAAGTRLGLSLGRVFGGHGFDVALIARSPERLGELTGKLAADGVEAAGFPADVTDRSTLAAALDNAATRFGGIDVLQYSAPHVRVGDGRMTGVLDVTVENLRPQIEGSCYGAITATRTVLPAMMAAGTGTLLYTTGASAVVPTPWAGSAGASGAALRNWALNLNGALADKGVYVGYVALGAWIVGTPGTPEDASPMEPDDIAHIHWDMHATRHPAERLITP
ncbi:SDR family NAD(P)-dependent oxidoreductase [Saccharothrix violaceirubra]|uniref:Short-subunit dehydrogenase n=1 Tax=Saccharothrix violaceirubra TaxID=413306 RepID=A0A7W7T6K4_9PSEU|nr:SDR family NAD(P)-dependent oxidoreductase [Saccharothrix violaceirubra]MBB4966150.1 short-subunit dehydrogenase [Saccharothrix violaceirubra]